MIQLLPILLSLPLAVMAKGTATDTAPGTTVMASDGSCGPNPTAFYFGPDQSAWNACIGPANSASLSCRNGNEVPLNSCACSFEMASYSCASSACPSATDLSGIIGSGQFYCRAAGISWNPTGSSTAKATKTGSPGSAAAGSTVAGTAGASATSSSNGASGNLARSGPFGGIYDNVFAAAVGVVGVGIGAAAVWL